LFVAASTGMVVFAAIMQLVIGVFSAEILRRRIFPTASGTSEKKAGECPLC
jgi:hypothetical protein